MPQKKKIEKLCNHKGELAEDLNSKLLSSFFKASYFFLFILFPLAVQQIFTVPFLYTPDPPLSYAPYFFFNMFCKLGQILYSPLDNFPRCHKDSKVCAMCAVYFRCKIPRICFCQAPGGVAGAGTGNRGCSSREGVPGCGWLQP